MIAPTKLLLICANESDRWQKVPLYEALVGQLLQLGLAGATSQRGIMGFGAQACIGRACSVWPTTARSA